MSAKQILLCLLFLTTYAIKINAMWPRRFNPDLPYPNLSVYENEILCGHRPPVNHTSESEHKSPSLSQLLLQDIAEQKRELQTLASTFTKEEHEITQYRTLTATCPFYAASHSLDTKIKLCESSEAVPIPPYTCIKNCPNCAPFFKMMTQKAQAYITLEERIITNSLAAQWMQQK